MCLDVVEEMRTELEHNVCTYKGVAQPTRGLAETPKRRYAGQEVPQHVLSILPHLIPEPSRTMLLCQSHFRHFQ